MGFRQVTAPSSSIDNCRVSAYVTLILLRYDRQ